MEDSLGTFGAHPSAWIADVTLSSSHVLHLREALENICLAFPVTLMLNAS